MNIVKGENNVSRKAKAGKRTEALPGDDSRRLRPRRTRSAVSYHLSAASAPTGTRSYKQVQAVVKVNLKAINGDRWSDALGAGEFEA